MSAGIYETVSKMMPIGQPTLTEGVQEEINKIIDTGPNYLEDPNLALRYGILLLQTDEPFHGRNILRHVVSNFKGTPQAGVAEMYLKEQDAAGQVTVDELTGGEEEEAGDAEGIGPEDEESVLQVLLGDGIPAVSYPWFTVWNGPGAERVDLKTERYLSPPGAQDIRDTGKIVYAFRFYDPSFQAPEPMFAATGLEVEPRDVFSEQIFSALVTLLIHLGKTEQTAPGRYFDQYTSEQIVWRDSVAEHIAEIAAEYYTSDGYEKWKADNEEIVQKLDESIEESFVGLDPYETLRPVLTESRTGIPVTKLYESGISKGPPKKEENRGTYIWRVEDWDVDKEYGDKPIEMKACYSVIDDSYIGDSKFANQLKKRGIKPQSHSGNDVASIGFSEKEKKWYGWSHRAIYGFGIGDKVKEGDITASSGWTDEYLKDHPDDKPLPIGFKAKTLDDAKKMAIAFASAVS